MEHVSELSKSVSLPGQDVPAVQFSFDNLVQQFEVAQKQSIDSGSPELRPFDVISITRNAEYLTQIGGINGLIGKDAYCQARNKLWQDLSEGRVENSEFDEKLLTLGLVRRNLEKREIVDVAALFAAAGLEKTKPIGQVKY